MNKLQQNSIQNTLIYIQEKAVENVTCKMTTIFAGLSY